ncbi:DUF3180 family protein [Propioniciclava soli]|uniref:DUF3180 family protein n=1 Tax=Propioniciclava soli TaxID=2775081 RepID=A0ABZ3CAA6_9ACTN
MSRPTVAPTSPAQVVTAAVAGFAVAWVTLTTIQGLGRTLPLLGVPAWGSVVLITAGIVWLVVRTRRELRRRPDTLEASVALNRLVLGKTSILAGAGLGAAYLALVVLVWPALPAPLAVERLVHGGAAVAACLAWAVAGVALERSLRIDEGRDESANTPGAGGPGDGVPPLS